MASQVTKRGPVKPSLNITPLIDVVFLLIVFFMLVQKIQQDDMPPLQLPDIEETLAAEVKSENKLVVNIIPEAPFEGELGPGAEIGEVLLRSPEAAAVVFGQREYPVDDADAMIAFRENFAAVIGERMKSGEIVFILRADAAIRYSAVMPVIAVMQGSMTDAKLEAELGAGTINIVAYREDS